MTTVVRVRLPKLSVEEHLALTQRYGGEVIVINTKFPDGARSILEMFVWIGKKWPDVIIVRHWTLPDGVLSGFLREAKANGYQVDVLCPIFSYVKTFLGYRLYVFDEGGRFILEGQMSPSSELYEMSIDELGLRTWTWGALMRSNILTVGQILEKTEDELLNVKHFGRTSLANVRERLLARGITFSP